MNPAYLNVSIVASRRHLKEVRLLSDILTNTDPKIKILDWTAKNLNVSENDEDEDNIFDFCRNSAMFGDVLIYYGQSGQDTTIQVGMAYASGLTIIGIRGHYEKPGVMLNGAVTVWKTILETPRSVSIIANCKTRNCRSCTMFDSCRVGLPSPFDEKLLEAQNVFDSFVNK